MNLFNQIFTILSDIYQSCQIIQTGCLLRMLDETTVESDCYYNQTEGSNDKFECDGYNNKFDVNNNKI